jgi:hypothetical protein
LYYNLRPALELTPVSKRSKNQSYDVWGEGVLTFTGSREAGGRIKSSVEFSRKCQQRLEVLRWYERLEVTFFTTCCSEGYQKRYSAQVSQAAPLKEVGPLTVRGFAEASGNVLRMEIRPAPHEEWEMITFRKRP